MPIVHLFEEFRRFQNIFEAPTSQEGINISVINIPDDTETPIL